MIIKNKNNESVIILLSGGIDSTLLLDYYFNKNYNVHTVHFQYGQNSENMEYKAIKNINDYYGINTEIVKMGFPIKEIQGEFMMRNALFILATASFLPFDSSTIAIGIHSGTNYYDATEEFIKDCQNIIDGYYAGTVTVDAPFILFSKLQVYKEFLSRDIPTNITYSCENGTVIPCGKCTSCMDRGLLNELKRM